MRSFLLRLSMLPVFGLCLVSTVTSAELPDANWEKLPLWRGFNLLEKFHLEWTNKPFQESDFQMISDFGFNFVRLPMDYRCWIKDGDWEQLDEEKLKEIDQAVAWGRKYGIHVCINFHRAPGWTVSKPSEKTSLWKDEQAQRVCAKHWAAFGKRYRGIPNRNLSFNLLNEPGEVEKDVYLKVMKILVTAIRQEDPERLIILDGLDYAQTPVPELHDLKVAQATRGYQPFMLSHYQAEWVEEADFPLPTWPIIPVNAYLYGASKNYLKSPMVIDVKGGMPDQLRVKVGTVSEKAVLLVKADGKEVFKKEFLCKEGDGEWEKAVLRKEWNIWQNIYNKDYLVKLPLGTKQISLEVLDGDWLSVAELGLNAGKEEHIIRPHVTWGKKQIPFTYDATKTVPFDSPMRQGPEWLAEQYTPWAELAAKGNGVMVGEFGAYCHTPHDVTLRWLTDCLKVYRKNGWGWALWNFRGSFGIMDSNRKDVEYEDYKGHKLDRKMLQLLQAFQ